MHNLKLALGLLSSVVAAEYTTTLLLVGLDLGGEPFGGIVGRVIGSDSTATTYSLGCPSFVGEACDIPADFTITQGPSTMHYVFGDGSSGGAMTAGCEITTDHGVCSGAILATGDATGGSGGATVATFATFDVDAGALAVTITAGGAAPGATGGSSTIAATSATTTTGGSGAGQTGVSSSSGNGDSSTSNSGSSSGAATSTTAKSSSSKVSTGGVPMITGPAQWVMRGAAAVVAIAAI